MSSPEGAFELQIEREMLHSTRLRQTIIALVFSVASPLVLGFMSFAPSVLAPDTADLIRGQLRGAVGVSLAVVVTYGFATRAWLGRLTKRGGRMPRAALLVGSSVEIALVTGVLFAFARLSDPFFAVTAPPTYLYAGFILLSVLVLDRMLSIFTGLASGLAYIAISLQVLSGAEASRVTPLMSSPLPVILRGLIMMILGGIAALISTELRRRLVHALTVMDEKNRAIEMFGRHVSPAVAEALLTSKVELRGEQREVCVMFLDIRDFTRFSEQRSPREVVAYLDTLFEPLVAVVSRHGGIVNKFLGDGFMAVFGAPVAEGDICKEAVGAALDIVAEVDSMVASGKIPPTRIGIGLHAGEAVTGTVGSSLRKEYTVVGDTVNLASRIEQLTKGAGARVLVSASVWERAREECGSAEPLAPVSVKGREAPVRVYKVA